MTIFSLEKIESLLIRPSFTRAEVEKLGMTGEALAYYVKNGVIERIAPGIYFDPRNDLKVEFKWQDLVRVAYSVKEGVLCLLSALDFYDLTEEIPRNFWIAIPHNKRRLSIPNARFIRYRNMTLGKVSIKFGEVELAIFDKERTVIDSFRYLDKEVAIKALRRLAQQGLNYDKISAYSAQLRTPIEPYVLAVTT